MKERSSFNIPPEDLTRIGASYSRVSADGESKSLEQQPHINKDWMSSISKRTGKNYQIKYELVEPEGTTGKNVERPEYPHLIRLIKNRKIHFVVVKGFDRLGRKLRYLTEFIDLCTEHGVELYINGMDVDLSTPQGKLLLHMLGAVAEMERESIIYRSKSSIRSAMKTLGKIHGGCVTLGYELDNDIPCGRRILENEANDVRVICDLIIKLRSYKEVCRRLEELGIQTKTKKKFTKDYLKTLLSNPIIIGKLRIPESKELVDIPTRIVSDDVFNQVQAVMAELKGQLGFRNKNRKRVYPLSGLIFTKNGSQLKATSGKGRNGEIYFYYTSVQEKLSYRCEEFEGMVVDTLFYLIKESGLQRYRFELDKSKSLGQLLNAKNIKSLEADLKIINLKIAKGADAILCMENVDPQVLKELQDRIKNLADERNAKEEQLIRIRQNYEEKLDNEIGTKSLEEFLNSNIAYFNDSKNLIQIRGFFRRLFHKIVVDQHTKEVRIFWNIEATQEEICLPFKRVMSCRSSGSNSVGSLASYVCDRLQKLTVEEKKTGEQIAKELGVSRATVVKYQKLLNLKVRPVGVNVKRARGVAYGKKVTSKGRVTKVSSESNIIQAMKTWKSKGKSLREIATLLNDQKIPTKTGKGPWCGKGVHQILQCQ